ncbi:unnamed protein product [Penicillium palitans]
MELAASENEAKISKFDEGQIWVKTCHNATRRLLALLLSRKNEKKLHIITAEIDLSSGDALDYGPRFVEPFPRDKMREYVVRERPWDGLDIFAQNIDDTPELRRFRRWANAYQMIKAVNYSLENFFGDDAPNDILEEDNELGSAYAPQWQWRLVGCTSAKDRSQPHINAFIADSQPHRAGRLNSGEVSLAYGLIAKRRIEDGYNDHRYIPITIVSASDFQVRILQMWHDKHNPKALQVRSSPIMDFKDGLESNLDNWVTILCWVAGKPVGDTKNGTEVVPVIEHDA